MGGGGKGISRVKLLQKTAGIYSLAGADGVGRGVVGILARKRRLWKNLLVK